MDAVSRTTLPDANRPITRHRFFAIVSFGCQLVVPFAAKLEVFDCGRAPLTERNAVMIFKPTLLLAPATLGAHKGALTAVAFVHVATHGTMFSLVK